MSNVEIRNVQIGAATVPNDSGINDPVELQNYLQQRGVRDANGKPFVDSSGTLRFEVESGIKG